MIVQLEPAPGATGPPAAAAADHPMRKVTRQVAFGGPEAWDAERRAKVAALFDGMAPTWTADRNSPERLAPVVDAVERGNVPHGRLLEIGSGTGLGTGILAGARGPITAVDLAFEMLRHAPAEYGPRVQADAARLPFPRAAFAAVVLVNALLFPHEVDRVLAGDGAVVWVNTVGEHTPIHLSTADVAAALPGEWHGVASRAGTGTWCVLRRRPAPLE